jgi:hypothetical protein
MTDHNTIVSTMSTKTTTSSSLLMDVFGKTVSDCLQDEFEMFMAEAVSELQQGKSNHGNEKSWDRRDDDGLRELYAPKESDLVSLLHSLGTTVNRNSSFSTNNDEDDERTDFLNERDQSFLRVPSKIAFKPRGRSYVLHIGEYNLMPVQEGLPEDFLNLEAPSPRKLEIDVSSEKTTSVEQEAAIFPQRLRLDPPEVIVQGREGVEILANKKNTPPISIDAETSKRNRWGLGRLSLRRSH